MRKLVRERSIVGRTRTCDLVFLDMTSILDKKGRAVGRHILAIHVSRSKTYPYHRRAA